MNLVASCLYTQIWPMYHTLSLITPPLLVFWRGRINMPPRCPIGLLTTVPLFTHKAFHHRVQLQHGKSPPTISSNRHERAIQYCQRTKFPVCTAISTKQTLQPLSTIDRAWRRGWHHCCLWRLQRRQIVRDSISLGMRRLIHC